MVENAIKDAWPSGIQRREDQEVLGHTVHDIKMNGYPWRTSEANIDNNRIINMIVQNLSKINLRLVGGINIKEEQTLSSSSRIPEATLSSVRSASARGTG